MIELTLPLPPSSNRYWRHAGGRVYLSETAIAYREYVHFKTLRCNALSGPLAITMEFYFKTASGALDNRIKQLLDALQGRAYENDRQIVEIHAYRHEDKHNSRVEVEVKELVAASG